MQPIEYFKIRYSTRNNHYRKFKYNKYVSQLPVTLQKQSLEVICSQQILYRAFNHIKQNLNMEKLIVTEM